MMGVTAKAANLSLPTLAQVSLREAASKEIAF
jgi:hypothetical protein